MQGSLLAANFFNFCFCFEKTFISPSLWKDKLARHRLWVGEFSPLNTLNISHYSPLACMVSEKSGDPYLCSSIREVISTTHSPPLTSFKVFFCILGFLQFESDVHWYIVNFMFCFILAFILLIVCWASWSVFWCPLLIQENFVIIGQMFLQFFFLLLLVLPLHILYDIFIVFPHSWILCVTFSDFLLFGF